jgi:hypothetical protein
MRETFTMHSDGAAIDLSRNGWEIVVIEQSATGLAVRYRVSCNDRQTGVFIGSVIIPAGPGGQPPVITAVDVVELFGGGYRWASIAVDIDVDDLGRRIRRVSERLRLWRRRTRVARPPSHASSVDQQSEVSLRSIQP